MLHKSLGGHDEGPSLKECAKIGNLKRNNMQILNDSLDSNEEQILQNFRLR